jgi:cell division protein FtsW
MMAETLSPTASRAGRPARDLDYPLLGVVLALLAFGLIMVASASLHKVAADPYYYTQRHLLAILLGGAGALLLYLVPLALWRRFSVPLYLIGLVLVSLVLLPQIGKEVNGARRWIDLGGFTLQPSELMKPLLILFFAAYLAHQRDEVYRSLRAFLIPLGIAAGASLLVLAEPDLGTAAVLLATALGMLWLGGMPMRYFVVLGLGFLAVVAALVMGEDYRLARVTSFLNPWADPTGSGYQLTQSLIALGRGEWFGVGLGDGIQKQYYLPEAHTDFIVAVVGEELGLIGLLFLIGLFVLLVWRAFRIGVAAEARGDWFGALLAQGIGVWIALQAVVNIGVNFGLLPTKGLTLPFLSYGGNSILVSTVAMGWLLRVDAENRRLKGGDRGAG